MAVPGHSRANVSMPAGLLARGSPSASRLLAQPGNGIWPRTRRSQLRGQPRIYPAFPFQPSRATVIYPTCNVRLKVSQVIPTIMANDLSTHAVMAVLDTAIHAFLLKSRSSHESQPMLTGISYG